MTGHRASPTEDERRDWARDDRDAKVMIGVLLVLQVALLGMLLWL